MIRHAVLSGTITAISVGVHGATTRSCLIASPSFPLSLAAGFLRAGSDAVDLASITLPTDKNLRVAASAQKHPARSFIDTYGSAGPTCRRPALRLCQVRQYSVLRPRVCSLPRFWLRRPSPLNLSRARRAPACGYVDNVRALPTYPTGAASKSKPHFSDDGSYAFGPPPCPPATSAPARPPNATKATAPSMRGFRQPFTSDAGE